MEENIKNIEVEAEEIKVNDAVNDTVSDAVIEVYTPIKITIKFNGRIKSNDGKLIIKNIDNTNVEIDTPTMTLMEYDLRMALHKVMLMYQLNGNGISRLQIDTI